MRAGLLQTRRVAAAAIAIACLVGAPLEAQTTGVLAGTVVAAIDGEPLKDTLVEVTPVDGGRTTKRKVKADGKFTAELPPGRYRLVASLPGFVLHEETIDVAAGETLSQAVRLKIGRLTQTTYVTAVDRPLPVEKRTYTERIDAVKRAATKERLLAPVVTRRVDPAYGKVLADAGKVGEVVLVAVMNSEGRLTDIRVISTAHDELTAIAVENAAEWHYDPARLNGRPVEAVGVAFRYVFSR